MVQAFQAIVHGLVQGVSFRYYTYRTAQRLCLVGWVRNLPDGTVEVWAEGDEGSAKELVSWLEQGPGSARVDGVNLVWREPSGKHTAFEIRYL